MDYGTLIRDAWRLTWRFRFLWLLGLLAGGGVGVPSLHSASNTGWQAPSSTTARVGPDMTQVTAALSQWVSAHVGLLVGAAAAVVALAVVVLVLSFVAQGGMAVATAALAEGRPTTLGDAWRAGWHFFWRYVGLWLLLAAMVLGVGAVLAAGAALGMASFAASGAPVAVGVLLAVGIGAPLVVAVLVAALAASIVVAYAQRIIAVEDVGPWTAIRAGLDLLRAHPGESLLVWLINVGLALGTGLVLGVAALAAVALLGGLGALMWWLAGLGALLAGYIGLALLVLLGAGLLLAGISNTFFWSYWTLAYLRLTGRALPAAA